VPASPTQTAPGVDALQKNEGANAIPK